MIDRRQCVKSLLSVPVVLAGLAPAEGAASPGPAGQELPSDGESYWNHLRWQFLIPEGQAYFNTGTLGASPRAVVDAVAEHLRYVEESLAQWDFSGDRPERLAGYRPEKGLRQKLADFVHCDMDEMGLTINATMAMNFVANGLDLRAGDEVLITDKEHPGGRSGWDVRQKRHGVVVREVPVPTTVTDPDEIVRAFAAAITPRTRVLAVPHITSGHGIILPVARLCALARERKVLSVIDGAQAVGHLHVNVRDLGCDAYFSSPHKWLLAPKGNGFLYIRRDVQERVWPTLASGQWDNHQEGMFRLQQYGTLNQSLLRGLETAVDFMDRIGRDRVETRVRFLGAYLRKGLSQIPMVTVVTPLHPDLAAGITTWGIAGVTGGRLQDELWERRRLRVRASGESAVRQSCHIYNAVAELDATLEVARALSRA
jgi:selenocysteine lyase/cysteine desulfurase